jgi:hypothetical protein
VKSGIHLAFALGPGKEVATAAAQQFARQQQKEAERVDHAGFVAVAEIAEIRQGGGENGA